MSQTDLLLSECVNKLELAQSFEDNTERRKKIAELIQLAWGIINNDYNEKPTDSGSSGN